MAVKVRWTPEADSTFSEIVDYLEQNWTEKEVQKFVRKTNNIVGQIKKYPRMFKSTGKEKVRKAVITKQNSLFYFFDHSDNLVVLLTFWDNRKSPKKLNL